MLAQCLGVVVPRLFEDGGADGRGRRAPLGNRSGQAEPPRDGGYGWSPLERAKGGSGDTLGKWFALPYGGPQRIVLAGFATAAEQGLRGSRRGSSRGAGNQPGSEIFQSMCALMANGARTILVSRWRTGGRTNFDLVREFVQDIIARICAFHRAVIARVRTLLAAIVRPSGE